MINFDKASIAPIKPEVVIAMNEVYNNAWGNPSSIHSVGREAKRRLEESRKIIASTINAEPEQIIFTSGSTEAINWFSRFDVDSYTGLEHHAFLNSCGCIEYPDISEYYHIPLNKKNWTIECEKISKDRNKKYSYFVEYINSEIGVINPVEKMRPLSADRIFVDASQAYGHIPIDVQKAGMDFMCVSGQKFGGPCGIGFLYVKDIPNVLYSAFPVSYGGQQERGFRAGTENVAGIVGMAKAAQIAHENMRDKRKKVSEIRNKLYGEITNKIPCAHLNGSADWRYRYEGNLNFRFDGYKGEEIQAFMDDFGVLVSTGSACASGSGEPSHVLKAIGLTDEEANSSIRFSFDSDNHIKEVDTVVEVLMQALEMLKK